VFCPASPVSLNYRWCLPICQRNKMPLSSPLATNADRCRATTAGYAVIPHRQSRAAGHGRQRDHGRLQDCVQASLAQDTRTQVLLIPLLFLVWKRLLQQRSQRQWRTYNRTWGRGGVARLGTCRGARVGRWVCGSRRKRQRREGSPPPVANAPSSPFAAPSARDRR
jgi:hypothetical protein